MAPPALTLHRHEAAHIERLLEQVNEIVTNQRYGTVYQPLICTRTGDITGYEALARFFTPNGDQLAPLTVFEAMHYDTALLRSAECDLKRLQLDHAPAGYELFLNLDPHALSANGEAPALLERLIKTPGVVIELIENTDIHDARASLELHRMMSSHGVRTALDDIGAPHALLSLDLITVVDFLKFDRSWFDRLEHDHGTLMFHAMLDFARQAQRNTVLEGVETAAMLDVARAAGVDRIQGFHFRSLFINIKA
jgi:EAL domain-containing protein (putative c-di-GMP-specific phosphodiesterase class I)